MLKRILLVCVTVVDFVDLSGSPWGLDLALAASSVAEADPYDERSVAADTAGSRPKVIYSRENAPATPSPEDLPLEESVSQYGVTWTFDKPARVGRFVDGDWYVVGPVTIGSIALRIQCRMEPDCRRRQTVISHKCTILVQQRLLYQ